MSKVSSAYVCSMGSKEFNITPNGDIYLCQWFISEGEKYIMGNVTKNSFYNTDLLKKVELLDHKKILNAQNVGPDTYVKIVHYAYTRRQVISFMEIVIVKK